MTLVAFSTGRPTVRSKVPSGAKRELAFVDGRTSGQNRSSGHRDSSTGRSSRQCRGLAVLW